VAVYGTESNGRTLEGFLGELFSQVDRVNAQPSPGTRGSQLNAVIRIFLDHVAVCKERQTIKALESISLFTSSVSPIQWAGILTGCPSTAAFAIALGPPNPPTIFVAEETLDLRGARFSRA